MKSLVVLSMFAGVLLIVVGYINQTKQCPSPKIEYRFIPRTFDEEQDNPIKVSQIFSNMFEKPTPWIGGFELSSKPTIESMEKSYISQG